MFCCGEQLPVAVGRELAVDAERRDLANERAQAPRRSRGSARSRACVRSSRWVTSCSTSAKRTSGLSKIAGSKSAAHRRPHPVLLLRAPGRRTRRGVIFVAADGRDRRDRRASPPKVRVDAEERERDDQQREDDLREASVLVDGRTCEPSAIKGRTASPWMPDRWSAGVHATACFVDITALCQRDDSRANLPIKIATRRPLSCCWRSGRDSNPRPPA